MNDAVVIGYRDGRSGNDFKPSTPGIRSANIINLTAREAFDRLKEFLDTLGIAVEAERIDDNNSMEYPFE